MLQPHGRARFTLKTNSRRLIRKQTLVNAERAAERGVDAVLVVAPHYFGPNMTDAAVRAHYLRVADECPVPVVLYNIPKYMHFKIAPATVAELATHENVIGIKDSSGDRELLAAYLPAQSNSFTVKARAETKQGRTGRDFVRDWNIGNNATAAAAGHPSLR